MCDLLIFLFVALSFDSRSWLVAAGLARRVILVRSCCFRARHKRLLRMMIAEQGMMWMKITRNLWNEKLIEETYWLLYQKMILKKRSTEIVWTQLRNLTWQTVWWTRPLSTVKSRVSFSMIRVNFKFDPPKSKMKYSLSTSLGALWRMARSKITLVHLEMLRSLQ